MVRRLTTTAVDLTIISRIKQLPRIAYPVNSPACCFFGDPLSGLRRQAASSVPPMTFALAAENAADNFDGTRVLAPFYRLARPVPHSTPRVACS
ncbi:unnamed protein product [Mesocestoides corti]|uniref:Uncharacterized protein n=1 Tax=Mesocestoides corti TaxID=53468 RepID=A0A0R3U9I5_MESCO|nr:unnamed protein product [Mesocestoides corti]